MRRVIVNEWMSLDGVVQAPIGVQEDTDGGFAHGGWHLPHAGDAALQQRMIDTIRSAGGFLLGRRTYESFAAHWPNASPAEQVIAEPLNTQPKYVASTTLSAPLAWANATLLGGDVPSAIAALKRQPGGDLVVFGSTRLVPTLLAHDLVDVLQLTIDPVILGTGKRIFNEEGALRALRLTDSLVTSTGAILATYTAR